MLGAQQKGPARIAPALLPSTCRLDLGPVADAVMVVERAHLVVVRVGGGDAGRRDGGERRYGEQGGDDGRHGGPRIQTGAEAQWKGGTTGRARRPTTQHGTRQVVAAKQALGA